MVVASRLLLLIHLMEMLDNEGIDAWVKSYQNQRQRERGEGGEVWDRKEHY